jgi:hypothetical protein
MSDMLVIVTSGRGGCVLPSGDPAAPPFLTSNATNKTTKCFLDINPIMGDRVTNITTYAHFHYERSQNSENRLLASSCPSASPFEGNSAPHWTDFHET